MIGVILACSGPSTAVAPVLPTRTRLPTFTLTPSPVPVTTTLPPSSTPLPADTATPLPPPTDTPTLTATTQPEPTATSTNPPPPAATPVPVPTEPPTVTPTPEPIIKYVIAGTNREFNCDFTYIYGTVQNANNLGLPEVEVRALGIHQTAGLEFVVRTDAEGRYEAFRVPLQELPGAEWAVMVMEDGREVSERFHWTSTPVCESDDTGHSQVLRVDWKWIE